MAIKNETLVFNQAFLREIKNDNSRLRHWLKTVSGFFDDESGFHQSTIEGPIEPERALPQMLRCLRDQLTTHFSLEEYFGYFDDALDQAPRLQPQAEILRSQHALLFNEICDLVDDADAMSRTRIDQAGIQQLSSRFSQFRARLDEHESDERDLIMQALYDDIGVGD